MRPTLNLFDPELVKNPYPIYAWLREHAPVCRAEPHGFWVISRYEDALFALKNHDLFSSAEVLDKRRKQFMDERLRDDFADLTGRINLMSSDPPLHTQLRKLIGEAFSPRAIARLEARIRGLAKEFIDGFARRDECDLMAELAVPLPVTVITELMGLPRECQYDLKRWSDDTVPALQGQRYTQEEVDRIKQHRQKIRAYLYEFIRARKECPGDDVLSDIWRGQPAFGSLNEEDVLSLICILLVAGNETTTNLIGNGVLTLLSQPQLLADLSAEPSRIPAFIEEVLRYCSPVSMVTRRAKQDVTLGGAVIPKDSFVSILLGSANRDPKQFRDPDRFDLHRGPYGPSGHLAFGPGIHHCVGAPLARLEARIAFEELLPLLPAMSLQSAQPEWRETIIMRGLHRLPLSLQKDRAHAAQ